MFNFFNIFLIVSLGAFLILFGGRSISIKLKEKINPIKLNFKNNGFKRIIEVAVFALVNIFVFETLFYSIDIKFKIFPFPLNIKIFDLFFLKIFGVVLILAGFAFFIKGLFDLGYSWRLGIDENNPGKLITRGIYSFTRNPIYIFFNLYFLGVFFIYGSFIFLILFVTQLALLHLEIIEEEKFLFNKFGLNYINYCRRVGRYFTIHNQATYKQKV